MDNIPNDEELVRVLAMEGMGYRLGMSGGGVPHWLLPDCDGAIPCDEFNPLTDANDTEMLAVAMMKKGCKVRIEWIGGHKHPCRARSLQEPDTEVARWAENAKRAVCKVIYLALHPQDKEQAGG